MFDIDFYMKSHPIVKRLENGEKVPMKDLMETFERYRSKDPII